MKNEKFRNLYCKLQGNLKIRNPSRRKGFTLIELIIVMFIIALAAGLVGIVIRGGSGKLELTTFTKNMSATLRYARSRAIGEKKVYSFIILEDKKAYGLYAGLPHSEDIEEAVAVAYETIPESLQVISDSQEDYFRINFYPRGNSSGGKIRITNQKGGTFFILINKITGSVKVKKNQNTK